MNNKLRYFIIMLLGVLLNEGLAYVGNYFPVWLDMSGTALAAIVLEPAAGLIVGLINNFYMAVFKYDQSTILYYSVSAAAAIIIGAGMRNKEGKLEIKRLIYVLPLLIVVATILSSALTIWRNGGVSDNFFEHERYSKLIGMGFNKYIACILSTFIIKVYDAIALTLIVGALYLVLPKKLKYPKTDD